MHIEPGLVDVGKIWFSHLTASAAGLYTLKSVRDELRVSAPASLLARTAASTTLVFSFFEILPHHPVGVSEVHLIMGSTLFLIFGVASAALGLAIGLLLQGLFFAPFDLPQYGMNVTTLLIPIFALSAVARKIIPQHSRYVDVTYVQALKMSATYQAGIVAWVAFWALYGQGASAENLTSIGAFACAYLVVIIVEPVVDLLVLSLAKLLDQGKACLFLERRLFEGAYPQASPASC